MARLLFALTAFLGFAPAVVAQDMPLAQILLDGQTWEKDAAAGPTPPAAAGPVATQSPDGGTTFRWTPDFGRFIAARQTRAPEAIPFSPYCPLRLPHGQDTTEATALTGDKDGRIYAATLLGIQVFDPTGRMCGVITAPPGRVAALAFRGDRLTAWVGGTAYSRKLKTSGVK